MASNSFLAVDVDVRSFAEPRVDTPFGGQTVNISKAEYIQLKWGASYWHKQFARLSTHREQDVQRLQGLTGFLQACAVAGGTPRDIPAFLPWEMTPGRQAYFGGKPPARRATAITLPDRS